MDKPAHLKLSDVRGLQRLANDGVVGIADLVEAMHLTIVRRTLPLGAQPVGRTRGITGLAYRSVRGTTRLVGAGLDAAFRLLSPVFTERPSSRQREAVLAAVNGLFGDHLAASGNPLATGTRICRDGMPLVIDRAALAAAIPEATGKLVVLVHGLCMNDRQWTRSGHDHGTALARDLGYTPVYLRYNSGRHISTNGRELAGAMEALVAQWPRPVERLAIVAHSMGGLVARSACHYGALAGHAWVKRLDDLAFLGTPHLGAPLERAGAVADLLMELSPYSAPFARLGKARSAGIKDLSHGVLLEGDASLVPLPRGVRCHAVAASRQQRPGTRGSRVRGDGLVPVASALGLRVPRAHRWVAYGMGHFDLLDSAAVYQRLRKWLGAPPRG